MTIGVIFALVVGSITLMAIGFVWGSWYISAKPSAARLDALETLRRERNNLSRLMDKMELETREVNKKLEAMTHERDFYRRAFDGPFDPYTPTPEVRIHRPPCDNTSVVLMESQFRFCTEPGSVMHGPDMYRLSMKAKIFMFDALIDVNNPAFDLPQFIRRYISSLKTQIDKDVHEAITKAFNSANRPH